VTDAAPGAGAGAGVTRVTRVPDPAVVTAFGHLRADAAAVLGAWSAPDAEQERLRRAYLAQIAAEPDAVAKAGPPAHLTASCVLLDPSGGQVLLTLHRKANAWFQFGGHLEATDATVWAAARREAREESGIDSLEPLPRPVQLDRHLLVGSFGACREHLDVRYAAMAPADARAHVSEESHDVRWWPVDALPADTRAELTPLVSLARVALGLG